MVLIWKSEHRTHFLNYYVYLIDRPEDKIKVMEHYLRATRLLRNYADPSQDPLYSQVIELDLGTVVSSVSGPKRPHDRVAVTEMKIDFLNCLTNKVTGQVTVT